jgi:sec-independent protein translocase protein TatC
MGETPEDRQPFMAHIGELRKRLIRVFLVFVALTCVSLYFTPELLKALIAPYGSPLKVIGPTESVAIYLRIALMGATACCLPYVIFELWGFVAPGLLPKERAFVYLIIPAALVLFVTGAAFSWFLLIPAAIQFLSTFNPDIFVVEWTSSNYVPFVTSLVFWLGICFELPLVAFVLAKMRIVNARLLLKGWRHAMVVVVIVAAVITPTVDPFNLAVVSLPLAALYFVSIFIAFLAQRQKRARGAGKSGKTKA